MDADRVGHQAYRAGSPIWRELVASLGEGILEGTGEIDRRRLGAMVFRDPEAMAKLNAIMHPRMAEMMAAEIDELRRRGTEVAVVDAALLLEAGWDSLVDEIWVAYASEEKVVDWLHRRNSLSEEDITSRIRSQLPFEERARHADVVVRNVGSLGELREKVEALWSRRAKGKDR